MHIIINNRIITKNIDKPATNSWAKKTDINNIVIPKSGCWINKKEDNKKIGKMILKPKFFPSIP